jgi:hypothetical protein
MKVKFKSPFNYLMGTMYQNWYMKERQRGDRERDGGKQRDRDKKKREREKGEGTKVAAPFCDYVIGVSIDIWEKNI